MNNNIYDIWFTRIEIGNNTKLKLINEYTTSQLWNMKKKEFIAQNIEEKIIEKILDLKYRKNLEKYYDYTIKNNIKLIGFKDERYPTNLSNIDDLPVFIYVRGNVDVLYENSVAIVGSRNATEYGKNVSRKMAKELADKNINIISGLAIGIDKYAHLGCLDSNIGKTVAVIRNRGIR